MGTDKAYISACLYRVRTIVDSGAILSSARAPYVEQWASAYTEAIINLYDAMSCLKLKELQVDVSDDVYNFDGKTSTLYDLIRKQRDAACHSGSGYHKNQHGGLVTFCRIGPVDRPPSPSDEVTILFGKMKVLYHRNLVRALTEAERLLSTLPA